MRNIPQLMLLNVFVDRESNDKGTLKLSPSTERRIELKLKEYRTPLTVTKSCDSPSRRRRSGEVASDHAKGSPSLVRIRRLDSKARADMVWITVCSVLVGSLWPDSVTYLQSFNNLQYTADNVNKTKTRQPSSRLSIRRSPPPLERVIDQPSETPTHSLGDTSSTVGDDLPAQ